MIGTRRIQRDTMGQRAIVPGFLGVLLLMSCAAAPFLIPAGIEFARNLLTTSNQNFGSNYSANMNQFIGRLSQPYMNMGLPPGVPPPQMAQSGYPGAPNQSYPGQPGYPGQQQGYPGQQQNYPGQPGYSQQPTPYDPYNPYGAQSGAYSGQQNYPAAVPSPYNTTPGYPTQPGTNPYDPYNQYGGAGSTYPGQSAYPGSATQSYPSGSTQPGYPGQSGATSPYGTTTNPPGSTNPYGTNPYGSTSPYGTTNPYGSATPYGGTAGSTYPSQQGYGQMPQGYPQSGVPTSPSYGAQSGYPSTTQPGYGTQGYSPPQPGTAGGYGYSGQTYGSAQYPGSGIYPRAVLSTPVAVDVALVRQKTTAKGKEVVLMNDGDVLKDGGSDPNAGDKFKLVVRTNCDCSVYIVAIDGSAWAQSVFPTKDGTVQNPVKTDQEYAFPQGPYWFSLDQVKGVETFYVVASANRRPDLEESMAQFAGKERPTGTIVAKVEEPPVIPRGFARTQTRGIITVKAESGDSAQVTPLSYVANNPGEDVTVTRWFKHE